MDKVKAVLTSTTFWAGVAMLCGAAYAAYNGDYEKALGLGGGAAAAWGLRLNH